MITKEAFLQYVEENYKDEDWSKLEKEAEDAPDTYNIHWFAHRRCEWPSKNKISYDKIGSSYSDVPTLERAQKLIEALKAEDDTTCVLVMDLPDYKEYHLKAIPETIELVASKNSALIEKYYVKNILDNIKSGDQQFPIYGP